jgi:ribosome-associated protein
MSWTAFLQDLGERLSELPDAVLRSLDLPERLTDALIATRKLRSHEGRRRHFQFIGKLMRTVDPQPIIDLLARRERPHREDVDAMHAAELWRERLIADDAVFDDLLRTIPFDDVQSLRINIRAARAEVAAQRHGRQYRLLYKRIHEAIAPRRAAKTANDDMLDSDHPLPQRNDS